MKRRLRKRERVRERVRYIFGQPKVKWQKKNQERLEARLQLRKVA